MTEPYEAVRVHLAGADPGVLDATAPRPGRRRVARAATIVLEVNEPCREIAAPDPDRCELWILADPASKFLVGASKGEIQNYADTTFAYPPGLLIFSSAEDGAVPKPYHTTEQLWAASPAASGATRIYVRVIMISEVS